MLSNAAGKKGGGQRRESVAKNRGTTRGYWRHSLLTAYIAAAERDKAAVAAESRGRAAGPGGMLRNATVGMNQAGAKVCETRGFLKKTGFTKHTVGFLVNACVMTPKS